MERTWALITAMGSTASQNLAGALRADTRQRWGLVGGDARRWHGGLGLCDVDVVLPRGDAPGYAEAVAEQAAAVGAQVVVPVFGPELTAMVDMEIPGATVVMSPAEAVAVCLSKRRLCGALYAAGIAHPPLLDPGAIDRWPVFCRPDGGTGSRGATLVQDAAGLKRLLVDDPDRVVTSAVRGVEHSVDGFAWPTGRLVHAIARVREEMKGGLAVRSTVVPLDPLREVVHRVVNTIGLRGFFNLQLFTGDFEPAVFDVNPRLGGAMALSFAAGLDAPAYLAAIIEGAPVPQGGHQRVGLRLLRRWHNVLVHPEAP